MFRMNKKTLWILTFFLFVFTAMVAKTRYEQGLDLVWAYGLVAALFMIISIVYYRKYKAEERDRDSRNGK